MAQVIDRFWKEYEFLSNFFPAPMEFEGLRYPCSENAYQAAKCANAEDKLRFLSIHPGDAKKLGREVEQRLDWEDIKVEVMTRIIHAKFSQNQELRELLLATGDAEIIEGMYCRETFWGVDLRCGEGENHLGKILMAEREILRKTSD